MKKKGKKTFRSMALQHPQKPRRIDYGTILLIFTAILLAVLITFLLVKGRILDFNDMDNPQKPIIERILDPVSPDVPIDPVIELGSPQETEDIIEEDDETPAETTREQHQARLFFIKVIDEKNIISKSVLRNVPASKSPMTVAINTLLEGPKAGELNNDIFTLIPKDSRLIGARVEGRIAYLDFNEEFRFNPLGIDGYRAQVEQIVYTATEFPTVDKVQFLVGGQRVAFLGGEGFWIGEPLGREDFK